MTTDLHLTPINHDALVNAFDAAIATAPDSRSHNALMSAYEALSQWAIDGVLVEQDATGHYHIESKSVPGRFYWVTTYACQCEAAARGAICWHRKAVALIEASQAQPKPVRTAARKARAYAEMAELFT